MSNICSPIKKTIFDFRENKYNIRKFQETKQQNIRTVRYGFQIALYRGSQIWFVVPVDLKSLPNNDFIQIYSNQN